MEKSDAKRRGPGRLTQAIAAGAGAAGAAFTLAGQQAHSPWLAAAAAATLYAITLLAMRRALRRYVYDRVRPIYKALNSDIEIGAADADPFANHDLLRDVRRDVDSYREQKSTEIAALRRQERYRREFLGNVSHELRTPIFNIQGYLLTLLDGGLEDPKINRLYLERAERSVNRAITIVEDLDALAGLESGDAKPRLEPCDLRRLADEVFDVHRRQAEAKQITLLNDLPDAPPAEALCDRRQMTMALSNLTLNAIRYGKERGYVRVRAYDLDGKWLLEVQDDGIGIEAEHLPRIFERFYRVDKGRSREEGGTGLGLSIVKHVVEAHGQSVNARSTPGQGTTFALTLDKAPRDKR